ncbi:MAG: RNA methyltransferase [Bacteroides sp. SM23_62_1]|nr:MAG: RNA methyltransferase [Bacteroides sp. SM23_62_1]
MTRKNLPLIEKVLVTDLAAQGKAIARIDQYVTFIANALPGDVVDLQVIRRKKSWQEAKAIHFHSFSDKRTPPFCEHFGICGGCRWQDLKYREQLYYKQKEINDQFARIGKLSYPQPEPIIGSESGKFYRNKLEFAFTNQRWLTREEIENETEIIHRNGLGFHVRSLYDKVIDLENCYLQPEPSNTIRLAIRNFAIRNQYSFFDLKNQSGLLRNLIIRTTLTGEVMVLVVFYDDDRDVREHILGHISGSFPEITSLMYAINQKANDSIYDLEFILYRGKDYIHEKLEDLRFRIGPKSFFQPNAIQASRMYTWIRENADLNGSETVYDLYTGTGAIAIFLAGHAKKVIGLEYIDDAVSDAKKNSLLNNISNTRFICGDIRKALNHDLLEQEGYPDIMITDPPRAGMHKDVIQSILNISPGRIIYISCNPATQARDVSLLADQYKIVRVQPFDMFPHTWHVENVVLLVKK